MCRKTGQKDGVWRDVRLWRELENLAFPRQDWAAQPSAKEEESSWAAEGSQKWLWAWLSDTHEAGSAEKAALNSHIDALIHYHSCPFFSNQTIIMCRTIFKIAKLLWLSSLCPFSIDRPVMTSCLLLPANSSDYTTITVQELNGRTWLSSFGPWNLLMLLSSFSSCFSPWKVKSLFAEVPALLSSANNNAADFHLQLFCNDRLLTQRSFAELLSSKFRSSSVPSAFSEKKNLTCCCCYVEDNFFF